MRCRRIVICTLALILLIFVGAGVTLEPAGSWVELFHGIGAAFGAPTNLLVNPDFESGHTGWTEYSSGGFEVITVRATYS